jgi:hypothetical protein
MQDGPAIPSGEPETRGLVPRVASRRLVQTQKLPLNGSRIETERR